MSTRYFVRSFGGQWYECNCGLYDWYASEIERDPEFYDGLAVCRALALWGCGVK